VAPVLSCAARGRKAARAIETTVATPGPTAPPPTPTRPSKATAAVIAQGRRRRDWHGGPAERWQSVDAGGHGPAGPARSTAPAAGSVGTAPRAAAAQRAAAAGRGLDGRDGRQDWDRSLIRQRFGSRERQRSGVLFPARR